jgi:fermentation-respiration switch protein FrsA (DUF1100 family)
MVGFMGFAMPCRSYQRKDGVALSATLYLPPDHQPGQKHPTLVWAYPQEFTRADDAGQVRASPTRYTRFAGISHLWLLLAGYAVLDDAAMPIVGPNRGANDTYVQQLTDDAQAAVDLLVSRGIADPAEIAVGGHSYGAFMSANLLCHTDLFATAIARSGVVTPSPSTIFSADVPSSCAMAASRNDALAGDSGSVTSPAACVRFSPEVRFTIFTVTCAEAPAEADASLTAADVEALMAPDTTVERT